MTKRKRRTKAEMEVDKAWEAAEVKMTPIDPDNSFQGNAHKEVAKSTAPEGSAAWRGIPMNEYADRVLQAQAPELTISDRVGRVRAALKAQGYSNLAELELKLPSGYEKFL